MAEHAGQKRTAVKFLNRGKKVDEHRAKGRETASDDPEDAHEVQGGVMGHNVLLPISKIFHRDDAHERAVSEPYLWAEHAVTTRANKGSKGRWKKRMEYETRSLERDKKERARKRRAGDRKSSSLLLMARTAFMPVLLACLLLACCACAGHVAADAASAAQAGEVVITMLPAGAQVRQVYSESILPSVKDALLIDCSTIDVDTAREVAAIRAPLGTWVRVTETGTCGVLVDISQTGWRTILCDDGEELKRFPRCFRLADGAAPAALVAKAAAWRKDCDASGVKSFYDAGVRL